jgi:hypothetical protein
MNIFLLIDVSLRIMAHNLKLRKFKPQNMDDNRICVFIGKRNTGKSVLLTDMLYHKRHIPVGVVMSGTEEGNKHYQNYVPDLFIYNEYKEDVLEKVVGRQKTMLKKGEKNFNSFIILDDCMYDKKCLRDKVMRLIFYNGRHWGIWFALSMQYCMDLTPDLRANIDYIFILRENIIQNREKIYKNFFGIFPNFDMFNQVMDACTENYECIVLDNTSRSNKIEDVVFWYKASLHDTYKAGHPKFWNSHKKKYDPKHDERDVQAFQKQASNSKKPTITVKKTK